MININLQLFGGRGSASGVSGSAAKKGAGAIPAQRKYSNKELGSMSKSALKSAAKAAYIGHWMRSWGYSLERATAAYNSLMASRNLSEDKLKKLIRKYQK